MITVLINDKTMLLDRLSPSQLFLYPDFKEAHTQFDERR